MAADTDADPLVGFDEPHALLDFLGPVGIDNVSWLRPLQINDRNVSTQMDRRTYAVRPGKIRLILTAGVGPVSGPSTLSGSLRSRHGDAEARTLELRTEAGLRYQIGGRITHISWEPYLASVTPLDDYDVTDPE